MKPLSSPSGETKPPASQMRTSSDRSDGRCRSLTLSARTAPAPAPPDGEDGAGAASRGDALDEEAADEFEDDEEEWLDIDAEDGWPAELR